MTLGRTVITMSEIMLEGWDINPTEGWLLRSTFVIAWTRTRLVRGRVGQGLRRVVRGTVEDEYPVSVACRRMEARRWVDCMGPSISGAIWTANVSIAILLASDGLLMN